MSIVNKAIELSQHDGEAYRIKGLCLMKFERYQDAIKSLDKSLELKPLALDVIVNKGMSFYNLEKYSDAIKCYDRALDLNSKDPKM